MSVLTGRVGVRWRPRPAHVAGVVLILVGLAMGAAAALRPTWVLAALVAGVAVTIGAARPQLPLALFLVSIPLEYGWEIHGNPSLTVTKFAGGLCFLSFGLAAAITRRRLRFDRSHALLLAILCLALASTAVSADQSGAITTVIRYANWVLLYVVLTQFAGERPATLRLLVRSLVVASAAAGVWGCIDLLSGRTTLATLPFAQPNDYAFVLSSVLFLGLWLVRNDRGVMRLVAALASACIFAGIVLSLSRGAYVALAVTFTAFAVLHRRQAKVILVLGVLAAVAVAAFVAVDPSAVLLGVHEKQAVASENVDTRLQLWRGAVNLALTHPLGVGPGDFGDYYYQITQNPVETPPLLVAHNTYLEVAADLGVLGLLLFVGFIGLMFRRLGEAIRTGAGPAELAMFLRLSLICISVGMLTVSEEFFAPLWLVGGFATLVWLERPSASSS